MVCLKSLAFGKNVSEDSFIGSTKQAYSPARNSIGIQYSKNKQVRVCDRAENVSISLHFALSAFFMTALALGTRTSILHMANPVLSCVLRADLN